MPWRRLLHLAAVVNASGNDCAGSAWQTWPRAKKEACCLVEGVGCPPPEQLAGRSEQVQDDFSHRSDYFPTHSVAPVAQSEGGGAEAAWWATDQQRASRSRQETPHSEEHRFARDPGPAWEAELRAELLRRGREVSAGVPSRSSDKQDAGGLYSDGGQQTYQDARSSEDRGIAGVVGDGTERSAGPSMGTGNSQQGITMFCFCYMRSAGYEQDLLRAQLSQAASIFACDAYQVFSDATVVLGQRAGVVRTSKVRSPVAKLGSWRKRGQTTDSWLNTLTFMQVWDEIIKQRQFLSYDWIVKVDPDAVFIPARLQWHLLRDSLQSKGVRAMYVTNCDTLGSALFGALEVFSRSAIKLYARGRTRCKFDLQWKGWGEDYYMRKCLSMLGGTHKDDFGVLSDFGGLCTQLEPTKCENARGFRAAFHPFKTVGGYLNCLAKAREADQQVGHGEMPREIHT